MISQDIERDLERCVGIPRQLPPLAQPVFRQQRPGRQTITGRLLRIVRDFGHEMHAVGEKSGAQLPYSQWFAASVRLLPVVAVFVAFLERHVDSVSNSHLNRPLSQSFGKNKKDGVGGVLLVFCQGRW